MVCQHKPNQWLHSPLGNAHTLCLHSPDFGTDVYQTYPSIPVTSECKKLGTCVTDAALHLHVHCVTSSTLPALIQAFERRHDHTCRGVAEAETIIFRLWLTAKFPCRCSGLPFRLPMWRNCQPGTEGRGDNLFTYRTPHAENRRPHVGPVHHRNVSYETWEA